MTNMSKRLYYQKNTTTVTQEKGYIEIDSDFSQVYDCFSRISLRFKSVVSVKLLFWLLSHEANKNNGVQSGKPVYERFSKYLQEEGHDIIPMRTFKAAFEELYKTQTITRVGKGHYYLNPHLFWRDDKTERHQFIIDERKDGKFLSFNPLTPTVQPPHPIR